jgi:hypothetical protein
MIGIIHIARSKCCRLNKAIFIYISVGFKTIGTLALAIRPLLYVPTRFGVLSVITVCVFVWAVAPNGAVIGHTIGEAQAHETAE